MTDEKPELIVVRDKKSNLSVAREILTAVGSKPQASVQELAELIDVPQDQIIHVLHNYGPDEDGGVEQRPEGQGGGWVPDEIANEYRQTR